VHLSGGTRCSRRPISISRAVAATSSAGTSADVVSPGTARSINSTPRSRSSSSSRTAPYPSKILSASASAARCPSGTPSLSTAGVPSPVVTAATQWNVIRNVRSTVSPHPAATESTSPGNPTSHRRPTSPQLPATLRAKSGGTSPVVTCTVRPHQSPGPRTVARPPLVGILDCVPNSQPCLRLNLPDLVRLTPEIEGQAHKIRLAHPCKCRAARGAGQVEETVSTVVGARSMRGSPSSAK
jgi:hypothetical protein